MSIITIVKQIVESGDNCTKIVYRDDGSSTFDNEVKELKEYVSTNKLYLEYDFWTDGCNYADEDYIYISKRDPNNDHESSGFCWRSAVWKFMTEDQDIDTEVKDMIMNKSPTPIEFKAKNEYHACQSHDKPKIDFEQKDSRRSMKKVFKSFVLSSDEHENNFRLEDAKKLHVFKSVDRTQIETLTVVAKLKNLNVSAFFDSFPKVRTLSLDGCEGVTGTIVQKLLEAKKEDGSNRLNDLILDRRLCNKEFCDAYKGNIDEFLKRAVWINTGNLNEELFKMIADFWFEKSEGKVSVTDVFTHHKNCRDLIMKGFNKTIERLEKRNV